MKRALFILMVVSLALLSVGCAVSAGQVPMPTVDVDALNNQIQSLQLQLDKLQSAKSNDTAKISELTTQIAKYQADIDKAETLDNMNWVFPGKVAYGQYYLGVVCIYSIKVHNGKDEVQDFYVRTEPFQKGDTARTPKDIQEWVTYDGTSVEILTMNPKETRDVSVQFAQPLFTRFYSITDKGEAFAKYLSMTNAEKSNVTVVYPNITNIELDVMNKLAKDLTVPVSFVAASGWESSVQRLRSLGMVQDDSTYEYQTGFGEVSPSGNVIGRSAIRWTITMSEFSK